MIITGRTRTTSLLVSEAIRNAATVLIICNNVASIRSKCSPSIRYLPGLMHNREKQEIKTVRIVKRESERRQRDRGDRTGNIGIPLTNGLQAPGGAKRLCDDDLGGSQKFEVIALNFPDPRYSAIRILQYIVRFEELLIHLFRMCRGTIFATLTYFGPFPIDVFLEGPIRKSGRRIANDSRTEHSPADRLGRRAVPKKHVLAERLRWTAAAAAGDTPRASGASS